MVGAFAHTLASHDLFGPQSNEFVKSNSRIYRSTDKGKTGPAFTSDGTLWCVEQEGASLQPDFHLSRFAG